MKEGEGSRPSEIVKKTTQAISEQDSDSLKNAFGEFKCMWFNVRLENADMSVCILFNALKDVFSSLDLHIGGNNMPNNIDFSEVSITMSGATEDN